MSLISRWYDMCDYNGCRNVAEFPLYEFREDYTKVWRHYCSKHEDEIAAKNFKLRQLYPKVTWRDVK